MENLRYVIVSSVYISILLSSRSLRYCRSTKNCLPKSTPWKMVILGVKVGILMKKSQKMENLRYVIVSSLYIALLLSVRSLRYYLSTKNCLPKSTLWKIVIFGVKVGRSILMKNL